MQFINTAKSQNGVSFFMCVCGICLFLVEKIGDGLMGTYKSICEEKKHWQTMELKNRYSLSTSKKKTMNIKKKISIIQE